MNSNGNKPIQSLSGVYVFCYEKEMSLLDLLQNPDAIREEIQLEVMEQWDSIVQAVKGSRQKAAAEPVNQTINPQMGQ